MTVRNAKLLSYLNYFYDNSEINIKIGFLLYSGNYWVKITNILSAVYPHVRLWNNELNAHMACVYFFVCLCVFLRSYYVISSLLKVDTFLTLLLYLRSLLLYRILYLCNLRL